MSRILLRQHRFEQRDSRKFIRTSRYRSFFGRTMHQLLYIDNLSFSSTFEMASARRACVSVESDDGTAWTEEVPRGDGADGVSGWVTHTDLKYFWRCAPRPLRSLATMLSGGTPSHAPGVGGAPDASRSVVARG